jgi:hypothetical protein
VLKPLSTIIYEIFGMFKENPNLMAIWELTGGDPGGRNRFFAENSSRNLVPRN